MDSQIINELERAKDYFYSWRLVEAYNILKRYFDRLPFKPEKAHATYISIFVRTLLELGKEYDLKFYMGELERHYERDNEPAVAYQLAVIYSYSLNLDLKFSEPRNAAVQRMLDKILRDPKAEPYHIKAKMLLASHYLRQEDITACREIIRSIKEPEDVRLKRLLLVWQANIYRYEKKFERAEGILNEVLGEVDSQTDWYAYFYSQLILAMNHVDQGNFDQANRIADEIKKMFEGKHFKTVQHQLKELMSSLEKKTEFDTICVSNSKDEHFFTYENKKLALKGKTPSEKLFILLVKNKYLEKENIVNSLYTRKYNSKKDDKLIYSHIHSVRKKLQSLGLPKQAITSDGTGYRLLPKVKKMRTTS